MKRLIAVPMVPLVALLVGLLAGLPSGYFVVTPGGSYEVEPLLEVPVEVREEMGRLAFTAVLAGPGSWGEIVLARFSNTAEVVPREEFLPGGLTTEELNEINRRMIQESKLVAAVVGLRAAGFDAQVTGEGALVVEVLGGSPAEGVLQAEDVIVAVDGQPTPTASAVVEQVRRHRVGEQVQLTVLRNGEEIQLMVGTRASPQEPGRPIIGVTITTRLFDADLPFPVEIETENIGGPSAGLMFSLGILDAVTDGLLTRGYYVAGTGTISVDGSVGPIGGAAQKVAAAREAGADVFLVPVENFEEARRAADGIQLVPVARFEEAVQALCALEPVGPATAELPPPCTDPDLASP